MKCLHPWKPPEALGFPPNLKLACNRCIGCMLKHSAEWATRCMHEAKTHQHNCWVTLTYEDTALPSRYSTGLIHPVTGRPIYGGTLLKLHVQKFIRKIRKQLSRNNPEILHSDTPAVDNLPARQNIRYRSTSTPILRYYYSGEYGERYRRPHYHACLFGIDFADKKLLRHTPQEHALYESETLKLLWPHGQHILSDLTWETAAYTARYTLAKVKGEGQKHKKVTQHNGKTVIKRHYEEIDYDTGEIITLEPEYNDMSRKPGIGAEWLQKWENDVYKQDVSYIRIRGNKTQPPRYYDKLHKKRNPEHHDHIKKERAKATVANWLNNTQPRLDAEEIITKRRIQTLRQHMETQ